MEREREQLAAIIQEWNMNRLDLFELSQPNEDLEFHGVMRFYFQDAGQKIATKCIRVSSTASTQDVINILIEKFRPDIRMLSIPEYALYETYENGEERKLADEEKPLLVQLNWHHDDREGRFLLRRMNEKSYLPGFDPAQSNFKRKLSKREKKEKRKAEKEMRLQNKQQQQSASRENEPVTKVAEKLYTEVPENSFTRSISNPEAVMRRRRKQKLEKKLQQFCQEGGVDAGGTLRIFGETLNPDVPYKTLLLSTQDTALYVVREILDKYGKEKEECNSFCLVQLIVPHELANGTTDFNGNPAIREYILDDDDCPLAIEKQHQRVRGSLSFHIRRRPADYQPRKKKKKPLHLKPEFEVNSEEILQRLHSLNPTTNNHHNHNHPHINNNHNGSNQMQQQQQQGADSGITSSGSSSREQQLLSEMQVAQKYMNESERSASSTNSQSTSQHQFAPTDDPIVTPHSPGASLLPNHPVPAATTQLAAAVPDGGHFFPNSDSQQQQLHQQHQQVLQLQHQQRDRRSGSDSGSAGVPMNGVAAAGQLLTKRQNTGPETEVIIFKKGNGGMGLSIVATQGLGQQRLGIYIKNVVPGGAADEDGRLQAGDQLLAVDGNSLIGVTQEQAAELISKTGPQVTLEVARNAAAYYGLANLLNQPSPQVARHPRIMSHSQSYVNQPQAQRQAPPPQQQHYMSQQFLPQSATLPAGLTHPGHGMPQTPSYANAPPPVTSSAVPGSHLMQQAQLGPGNVPSLLQSQSTLVPEERHYQNISMYRQPQPPLPNPPNGMASNASVRALNNPYPHPPHHNSYSSLQALSASTQNSQQQVNSATLPGRPMSTVYPNNMMGRVASMAQYPTYTGPSSQMQAQAHQQQMYRSVHTGSVPALHPSHSQWGRDGVAYGSQMYTPGNGTIPGMSHMNQSQQQQLYARNAVAGAMMPPPGRVSIVSAKGLVDGEQPPTGYRYVPSAYPTKSMDSLNNNNNMMMNGHNNNNNSMNQLSWRRNKNNNSNSAQEFNAQVEEQEERLRLLKLEEIKRHHELEVAQIQIAEDRLLKEAKTRRGQDEDGGAKLTRAYQEPEVPPPLPKSPPPLDPAAPPAVMQHPPSNRSIAFRSHLMQPTSVPVDDARHQAYPSAGLRPNGDLNGGYVQSAGPVPAKKVVSWNDAPSQPVAMPSSPDVLTNGGNSSSGITLEDIDEVLGSSAEQDEPSALIPNTPNVIGSQEVYRDPRERMMQEKMKNKPQVTAQGPEKLSFKEKMQMFAIQQSAASSGQKAGSSLKSGGRDGENGNANSIPEEES